MNVQIMNLLMSILPKKANHLMSCYESQPIPWIHILATQYKKWEKVVFQFHFNIYSSHFRMIPVSPKKKLFLMMQDQSSQISNCKENFDHIYAETVKLPLIRKQ